VKKLIVNDTYTFLDCADHPMIMEHHVRSLMRKGNNKGYPVIDGDKGDVPPDSTEVYDATSSIPNFKPHMTKPHPEIIACRTSE